MKEVEGLCIQHRGKSKLSELHSVGGFQIICAINATYQSTGKVRFLLTLGHVNIDIAFAAPFAQSLWFIPLTRHKHLICILNLTAGLVRAFGGTLHFLKRPHLLSR